MALGFKNGIVFGGVASAHLDTPVATTFGAAEAGDWKTFQGVFVNDYLNEFAIIGGKLTYQGASGLFYKISYHGSITSTSPSATVDFNIEINGTIEVLRKFFSTILCKTAGETYSIGGEAVVQLNYGDEIVIVTTTDKNNSSNNAASFTTVADRV